MSQFIIFTSTKMSHNLFLRTSGPYRIATELRRAGYSVQVIDYFTSFSYEEYEKIIDKYVDKSTLAVCFSNTFMNIGNAKYHKLHVPVVDDIEKRIEYIIRTAKNKNKMVKSIIGGPRTISMDVNDFSYIDIFMLGYSDESIITLANKLLIEKNVEPSKQAIIDGYPVQNFNSFTFNTSKISWADSDFVEKNETLPIEISRGCKFNCAFCNFMLTGRGNYDLGDYVKTEETLYSEFMENYQKNGTTNYYFCDETFNESIQKLEYILSVTKRLPFKIQFSSFMRHDLIYAHREMADIMLEMGLRSAIFGIETFDDAAGKIIGKGLGQEKTKILLHDLKHNIWKNNVSIHSSFICGLPGESPSTFKNNILEYFSSDDCDLDSLSMTPLFIFTQKNDNIKKYNLLSKFDKEMEKFKIIALDSQSNVSISDTWDTALATQVIKDINESDVIKQSRKISNWMIMSLLQYYDFDKLIGVNVEDCFKNMSLLNQLVLKNLKYKQKILL